MHQQIEMSFGTRVGGAQRRGIGFPDVGKTSNLCFTDDAVAVFNFDTQSHRRTIDSSRPDREPVLGALLNADAAKTLVRNTG